MFATPVLIYACFSGKTNGKVVPAKRNPYTKRVLGERCLYLQDPLKPPEDLCFNRKKFRSQPDA